MIVYEETAANNTNINVTSKECPSDDFCILPTAKRHSVPCLRLPRTRISANDFITFNHHHTVTTFSHAEFFSLFLLPIGHKEPIMITSSNQWMTPFLITIPTMRRISPHHQLPPSLLLQLRHIVSQTTAAHTTHSAPSSTPISLGNILFNPLVSIVCSRPFMISIATLGAAISELLRFRDVIAPDSYAKLQCILLIIPSRALRHRQIILPSPHMSANM